LTRLKVRILLLLKSKSHGEEDATVVPEVWECVVCSEACVAEVVPWADLETVLLEEAIADLDVEDTDQEAVVVSVTDLDKALHKVWISTKKLSLPK
jgi:hypothetical protein